MKSFLIFSLLLGYGSTIPKPGSRIIGGENAEKKEFPYMAAIWTYTDVARYFCGGVLINNQWILTAGHCVLDAKSFTIQLGAISLNLNDENRIISDGTPIVHPDFNVETLVNNIGLIKLSDPLELNEFVNAINLPSDKLAADIPLTAIGWGQTDDEHSGPVDMLQKVPVVSLLNEHCQNIYGSQITEEMVCAIGSYNEGTCIGDTGGPLIQLDGDTATVVGIASFISQNGCESIDPSGFTRTFSYLDWINQQISA